MPPMDHFPRIIQHLSSTRLLRMALNPSLFPIPLLHLLCVCRGRHRSLLSERFLCSERLLSHRGSVKWGFYLSSLNVSKRIGNQWCIPVHENFSVNLMSPPTYLFVHLSLCLTLSLLLLSILPLWLGSGFIGQGYFFWGVQGSAWGISGAPILTIQIPAGRNLGAGLSGCVGTVQWSLHRAQ